MAQILNEKIFETSLANGMQVVVYDNSKLMAADRWYISLTCRCEMDLPASKLTSLALEDEILTALDDRLAGKITHVCKKERNFVDAACKDEVVEELLNQLQDTTLPYLAAQTFVERLFQQNVDDFVQEYKVRQELGLDNQEEEEDDGPADFSACFRDDI